MYRDLTQRTLLSIFRRVSCIAAEKARKQNGGEKNVVVLVPLMGVMGWVFAAVRDESVTSSSSKKRL